MIQLKSPGVSVLLPLFNAGATLERSLDSLRQQTHQDFEIIAVDDGSSDETRAILQASGLHQLVVVEQQHAGIVAALNAGLERAHAPLIARMDGDDRCHPERLARQLDWLEAHPEFGLVGCRTRFAGDAGSQEGYARYVDWTNELMDEEAIRLNRFIESPLPHPSVMFRRELVNRHGGYRDGDFPEDYELWLRWMDAGVRMGKVDAELLDWHDGPERLSRRDPRYRPEAFFRIKARYLARWLIGKPKVVVAGAGRLARRRAEMMQEEGVPITAWLDVDPRKVGREIDGKPVLDYDALPQAGKVFVVSYVAKRGAREKIRETLEAKGYLLGEHFILAA